jgi:hypothetical protein
VVGGGAPGRNVARVSHERTAHRLGLSRRRAHGKKRPAPNEERKAAFLEEIRQLLRTVPREDVINADESAFLLYRWARRGAEGVQIPIYGNEKLTYTVMVAITAALTKLPIQVIVRGKAARAETALGAADAPLWDSDHTKSGWMNVAAMARWLHRLRELPQYADHHPVHLILDTCSALGRQEVRDVARSPHIVMHFIPTGDADTMQLLHRYVREL